MLEPLLSASESLSAQINCVDEFGRSPLYWAVQRGHYTATKSLIDFGANLEQADGNRLTPLSISAHAGDVRLCRLLLEHGAQYIQRDRLGLTAMHYAAFAGHEAVAKMLAKKLTLHSRGTGVDFDLEPEGGAAAEAAQKSHKR
jgi:ankyrin repeat protein